MGLFKNGVIAVLVAFLFHRVYFFLVEYGIGVHHNNIHPGPCRIVPGITCGSEQISVTQDGLAFITSGYRGLTNCNTKYVSGHLYVFDFNHPDNNVTKLEVVGTDINLDSYDPHGMDILEEANAVHVYVVNHAEDEESVEVFKFDRAKPKQIAHVKTIRDEKFVCINDLALVDEDHFYITNFHKYCKLAKPMMMVELMLGLKSANIVLYKEGKTNIVEEGYFFNGITMSKSRNQVVVNHGGKRKVDVFEINNSNGELTLKNSAFVGYPPDNIFLDKQTGNFYVGLIKDLGFMSVVENKTASCSASGAVLSVKDADLMNIEVEEGFHDNGEEFVCAASSFVHYKGQYLLGTIFDKLGYCIRK